MPDNEPGLDRSQPTWVVDWDGPDDQENPHNWSTKFKLVVSLVLVILPLIVNIGSSIMGGSLALLEREFHIGSEVAILTTTTIGVILFATFCIPVAVAENFYTILISRFFSGAFGASSMAVTGGALTDMWNTAVSRGISLDCFVATAFVGPVIGPLVGNFITQSHLGWRWTMWITMIAAYSFSIVACVVLPETYAPTLLTAKAARLRIQTKNWALHSLFGAPVEYVAPRPIWLKQPANLHAALLATEPIMMLVTLYMSFLYGLLFLFFEGFPVSFVEQRGWKPQIGSLSFLSLFVGILLGLTGMVTWSLTIFVSQVKLNPGKVVPELRLPPMMVGAVGLPIGLFWFAWTGNPNIQWSAEVVAPVLVSASMFAIFISGLKYVVDVYLIYANSAISANTVVRSCFGAGFPLFANAMYHRLGFSWATSLLAFLAVAMAPVPVILYLFGQRIRMWSRMAANKT
ncbi:hypothetical protein PENSUB_7925 [Penicillium subrubescens]|uniref:Major facilitator superfamily (MFS) profile domain-containing protein n=1 Tax=Penicillium subrubescens TaxID=1316194 RepID=A0A1Q5TJS1_9EURO|nr:hypothetical protein PENSUB_7925 [Penicillium subrubescens]